MNRNQVLRGITALEVPTINIITASPAGGKMDELLSSWAEEVEAEENDQHLDDSDMDLSEAEALLKNE